jgi:hypothetical protein
MDLNRERSHCHFPQRFREPEPMQDARGVGTDLDARADLMQSGRLFENRNLETRAAKRQRRRESADSCANHDSSHGIYSPDGRGSEEITEQCLSPEQKRCAGKFSRRQWPGE